MADAQPNSLYRYYDRQGVLLYAGITGRGMARNGEHNRSKPWWRFVVRQEVEHFPDRADALDAERRMIRLYRPPYNIQHNPDHDLTRAAYEAGQQVAPPMLTPAMVNARGRRVTLAVVHQQPSPRGTVTLYWLRSDDADVAMVNLIDLPAQEAHARSVPVGGAGMKPSACTWREGDSLFARIGSATPGLGRTVSARLKFVSQKPVSLTVAAFTILRPAMEPL